MEALLTTQLEGLAEPRRGKVREVYDLGDRLLMVATDRISAFDVVMANGVPHKGAILNQLSAFWFARLSDTCPNHLLTVDDYEVARAIGQELPELRGRCTLARKAKPLPVECIARGYLAGSLYKEYRDSGGSVPGAELPPGLLMGDRLPEPLFTPSTKAQSGHDLNITFDQMVDLVGKEVAEQARDWTLELFRRAAEHAASVGIILADSKLEFGLTADGLMLIDEAFTPDSSRFWDANQWKPGAAMPSFDKQFVRDYLDTLDWDKRPPGPYLPTEVVVGTQARYLEAYRLLVGRPFGMS